MKDLQKTSCTAKALSESAGSPCEARAGQSVDSVREVGRFRLKAFGSFGDVELDRLSFLQAAKAACLDGRKMHKHVVAGLAADEAEAFGVVKPFHCSLFHCVTCFYFEFLLRRIAAGDKGWRWLAGPTFNCW